jgi:hypothetical protein
MAKFTIGIPTYNRAGFLGRALESALDQTWHDVEVLVSDNASTDETAEVVRTYGDRVRYHRNPENLGMWPNFVRVAELAGGEYFGWLQDDDLIHRDFARRAVEALESDENIKMYTSYSIDSHSYNTFIYPAIIGPPIAMDWMRPELRVIEGSLLMPLSFFESFSTPPVTAYRTEAIRRAVRDLDPGSILFNERILQVKAVADGKVAVDPWLGGIFYKHETQGSLLAGSLDARERSLQWVRMADELGRMLEERPDTDWRPQFDEWLESLSAHGRRFILHHLPPAEYWPQFHPSAHEICSRFLDRLPEATRREHFAPTDGDANHRSHNVLKEFGRRLTPPLLWDALRRIKGTSTADGS